jgi:hypothetical protein
MGDLSFIPHQSDEKKYKRYDHQWNVDHRPQIVKVSSGKIEVKFSEMKN